MDKFYITTPIYYTNAKPHIGHAYTTVACDVLARWNRLQGKETFFLTGTDEHGAKIEKKAKEEGREPQEFVDEIAAVFVDLWKRLNISNDGFIRTTSPQHKAAVRKVLQTLYDNGSIYKGTYKGLYCVGCEQFKSENELVDGKCPDHNAVPEEMEEECYLMKMNKWQNTLIEKIKSDEFKIQPERYKKEILSFLESQKLEDVSISRKNLAWGIPLPFDNEHTTYVWIDAFLNYLTGLGWDGDLKNVPAMWPAEVEMLGKDILRVHATIWAATLLNLGIELPKSFFIHGHILSGGKKMSKTLGNVIGIDEMLEKFGVDGTRYLLMSGGTFGDDLDLTMERMTEKYNNDLANGLGNLVSRVIKLGEKVDIGTMDILKITENDKRYPKIDQSILLIDKFEIDGAIQHIWDLVRGDNRFIEDNKPWELAKSDEEKFNEVMSKLLSDLSVIAHLLKPFMPETSEKIRTALETRKAEPLFQRIK
ncbi:MAG: Methionine-tRNA ligase [Candidatus Moranbacteria bacterium GW2011_GWE1_49_15]|nr:MAG: Methionine-tRNA ligase [Candidatus Moranbacteria bacterium GW2011_GWE2_47_10]KKW06872.1 MAG: Methionine-tRNA ligase [Candidatus Moranbacteria bacterium GW2011_GWE1_49_15]HBP00931.1 methionine--tRNA ligase [Candidatus Moranbacteria bacterium]